MLFTCNTLDESANKDNVLAKVFYSELYFSNKNKCKYYGNMQLNVQISLFLTQEGNSLNKEA